MKKVGIRHAVGNFFRVIFKGDIHRDKSEFMSSDVMDKFLEGISHRRPIKIMDRKIFVWHAPCSKHYWYEPTCRMCMDGHWVPFQERWRKK